MQQSSADLCFFPGLPICQASQVPSVLNPRVPAPCLPPSWRVASLTILIDLWEDILKVPSPEAAVSAGRLAPPCPTQLLLPVSDIGDSATVPVVTTQVKLGGCSHQGGGNGFLHPHQDQELQAFLHLLGEFTGGLAWEGLWGQECKEMWKAGSCLTHAGLQASQVFVLLPVWKRFGRWKGISPEHGFSGGLGFGTSDATCIYGG